MGKIERGERDKGEKRGDERKNINREEGTGGMRKSISKRKRRNRRNKERERKGWE